jgi:UDP-N-acetylmuramyl pentapeptide phosphotransferase/UDP-N-acetylglucosamine-1-phosphate transferase
MSLSLLFGFLFCTAVASSFLTWAMRELAWRRQLLDPLTPRSSHSRPTPRLGGVAIAATAISGWAIYGLIDADYSPAGISRALLWGGVIATATGLIDDLLRLPAALKFVGELLSITPCILLLAPMLLPDPFWLSVTLCTFVTVAYMNLFNFMDGSDGLAAGVAVINAFALAALTPFTTWRIPILVIAAAALGFLRFNRAPASVFMGDAGSLFLGYGFATIGALIVANGASAIAVGLALAPITFDGTLTLILRCLRRERIWEAHRSHLYQRLLIAGWNHRDVARLYWIWAAMAGVAAIEYVHTEARLRVLITCFSAAAAGVVVLLVRNVEQRAAQSGMTSTEKTLRAVPSAGN